MNLSERTVLLIKRKRNIYLKNSGGQYLHQWSNIAGGPDRADWTFVPCLALEIFNLEWAFALAKLYKCKVVSRSYVK